MREGKKMKSKKNNALLRQQLPFHILWLPFLILFFTFTILPLLSSIALSFTDFDAVSFPKFVGLENYFRMFTQDDVFPYAIR